MHQEPVGLMSSKDEEKWSKAIFWVFDAPELREKPLEVKINKDFFIEFLGTN